MTYFTEVSIDEEFATVLANTRSALSEQGFGVITEIDMQATMKAKLDVDIAPYVILGACNPKFAREALELEPTLGVLLPCNVVVRQVAEETTVVEAIDPATMVELSGNPAMAPLSAQVGDRLAAALASVN
jgi:uncharacterized protein (DUF302 family)